MKNNNYNSYTVSIFSLIQRKITRLESELRSATTDSGKEFLNSLIESKKRSALKIIEVGSTTN